MSIYGYCRVSTSRQANEGDSLDVQKRQIEGWAHMHGERLERILVEEGVSGSIPIHDRPVGGPLFDALSSGDVLVAAKLDRLFRSALDALTVVEDLKKRKVKLCLLDLGGDVAENGLSRLFLTIAAAFAEAERDRIRERVCQSVADARARGRHLGGAVPPFGYRLVPTPPRGARLEPDPDTHQFLKIMQDLRIHGSSYLFISKRMSDCYGLNISEVRIRRALQRETVG